MTILAVLSLGMIKNLQNKNNCAIIEQKVDVKKIKRRIVDWLFKTAYDEEIYEIAKFYNIKTD